MKEFWRAYHKDMGLEAYGETPQEAYDLMKEQYKKLSQKERYSKLEMRFSDFTWEDLHEEVQVRKMKIGEVYHSERLDTSPEKPRRADPENLEEESSV